MRWALPDCLACTCTRGFGALASEWGPPPRQSGPDVNSLQGAVLGAPETDCSRNRLGKVAPAGEVLRCREGSYSLPWAAALRAWRGAERALARRGRPHEEPGGAGQSWVSGKGGQLARTLSLALWPRAPGLGSPALLTRGFPKGLWALPCFQSSPLLAL